MQSFLIQVWYHVFTSQYQKIMLNEMSLPNGKYSSLHQNNSFFPEYQVVF